MKDKWDIVIEPNKRTSADGGLGRRLSLIGIFIKRDLKVMYTQTVIGPLWHIINPVLISIVFTIAFGKIAKISTDGVPAFLFYMSGSILWGYFSSAFTRCANTFTANARLFSKVYFPRVTVPVSVVISRLVSFAIQLAVFIILVFIYKLKGFELRPNAAVLLLPVVVLVFMQTAYASGLIVSSLTVKYKDLSVVTGLLVQVWMYVTPVVYPASLAAGKLKTFLMLNPLSAPMECFRYAFFGCGTLELKYLLVSFVISLLFAFAATVVFNRAEKNFVDKV